MSQRKGTTCGDMSITFSIGTDIYTRSRQPFEKHDRNETEIRIRQVFTQSCFLKTPIFGTGMVAGVKLS